VVGAAGNSGVDGASYPAAYDRAMSVAASGTSDRLTFFSNRHRTVDITAPGQAILSTVTGSAYDRLDGTSMASPVVAGVAAMVRMMRPSSSAAEVATVIKATAWNIDTLNPFAVGRFGTGRVDAYAAVASSMTTWASVLSASFKDESDDGLFTPGERARISLTVRNDLAPLTNATVRVRNVPAPFAAIIEQQGGTIGAMGQGETREARDVIVVSLPDEVPFNASLDLLVEIIDN
jgi:subtilisin family serine protease